MKNPPADTDTILVSLKRAVSKALDKKRRLGQYAVLWQDGKRINDEIVKGEQAEYGQRVIEGLSRDLRYYNFIKEKISLVVDLYETDKYAGFGNYYNPTKNPLSSTNKISPPCT